MDAQGLYIQKLWGCNKKSCNVTLWLQFGHFVCSYSASAAKSNKAIKSLQMCIVLKLNEWIFFLPLNSQTSEFLKIPESALHFVPLGTLSFSLFLTVCDLRKTSSVERVWSCPAVPCLPLHAWEGWMSWTLGPWAIWLRYISQKHTVWVALCPSLRCLIVSTSVLCFHS